MSTADRQLPGRRQTTPPMSPAQLLFTLATYTHYVVSNTVELHDGWPNNFKHYFFVAMALWSLSTNPQGSLKASLLAMPIALIYSVGGLQIYAVMVFIFAAAIPFLTNAILDIIDNRRYGVILIMAGISFIPALLSLDTIRTNGILDATYGRERALLGYFHPKEAGICFGIPIILACMAARRMHVILTMLGAGFIFVVGSRNGALIIAMYLILRKYPRLTVFCLLGSIIAAAVAVSLDDDLSNAINTLMSLRLSNWGEALRAGDAASQLDVSDGERLAIDNFFVESYASAGVMCFPLLAVWLTAAIFVARQRIRRGNLPWVAFWMLIIFSNLDSGIASTGNLMHAFLWAIFAAPITASKRKRTTRAPVSHAGRNRVMPPLEGGGLAPNPI